MLSARVILCVTALVYLAVGCTDSPSTEGETRVSEDASPVLKAGSATDPTSELRQLLIGFSSKTFSGTYAADLSSLADEADAPSTITLTFAVKGNRSRTTFALTGAGVTNSLISIQTPGLSVVCIENIDPYLSFIPIKDHQCIDASTGFGNADAIAQLNFIDTIKQQKMTVTQVTKRTVNGDSATCYKVRQDEPKKGSSRMDSIFCWNAARQLVSMEDEDGSGRYTLTDFKGDVADDMFDVPYPISKP